MKSYSKHLVRHLAIGVLLLFIVISILNFSLFLPLYWENLPYYSGIVLFVIGFILLFIEIYHMNNNKRKNSLLMSIISYIFLALLLIFIFYEWIKIPPYIKEYKTELMVITIALGFLTIYAKKDFILSELETEERNEELNERKRYNNFPHKFPRLNKNPITRPVARWIYKEGVVYLIGLMIIVIIAAFLLLHNLGSHDFREDEFLVINAASGYYHKGTFYSWNWITDNASNFEYTRAWPHTWLIAQSYKVFGISEWSSRFFSVVFGLLFLIISYFFFKFFLDSKKIALLICLVFSLYPSYIDIFRYARMYALLLPFYMTLSLFCFLSITKKNNITFIKKSFKYFDFNIKYVLISIILLIIVYNIHINAFVIMPILLIFSIYLAISTRETRNLLLLCIGVISLLLSIILITYTDYLSYFYSFFSFFGRYNIYYLGALMKFPLGEIIGIILIFVIIPIIFSSNRMKREKLTFLYISIISSFIFFVYIADRYTTFLYISHITPFSVSLIIFSYSLLLRSYNKKVIKYLGIILIFILLVTSFYFSYNQIYNNDTDYGKFSEAYQTIASNYKPGEVIFGQYLRTYYLDKITNNASIIDMKSNKHYTLEQFLIDINNSKNGGWITFEARKNYHIRREIIDYISKNFHKIHGTGIDNTRVDIFYFNKTIN